MWFGLSFAKDPKKFFKKKFDASVNSKLGESLSPSSQSFKTSRKGVLIVIWASLDFCHDRTTFFYPPPHLAATSFSFCILTSHCSVSNKLNSWFQSGKVANEIIIVLVALCWINFFHLFRRWKRICQLKELCLIKLVDNNLASIFNVALIFAKTLMFLLFHYFISTKKAKLLPLSNLP